MKESELRAVIETAAATGLLNRAGGRRGALLRSDDGRIRVHLWDYPDPFVPLHFMQEHFKLTPRQAEAARLLIERRTNAEIAAVMGIAISTACKHVEAVLLKLGAVSRFAVENLVLQVFVE